MLDTSTTPCPSTTPPPAVVIDTQVVMDWLVFHDARVQRLADEVSSGRVHWLGQPAMLAEILHVLGRGVAANYAPDPAQVSAGFAQYCNMASQVPPRAVRLICRDPNDQMFIDLAVEAKARWLISRDRAVLALAKRARAFGVEILTPERWTEQHQQAALPPSA